MISRNPYNFTNFTPTTVGQAIRDNSRVFGVLRAILGMTPPEWAALARTEGISDVGQGPARILDRECRSNAEFVRDVERRNQKRVYKTSKATAESVPRPKSLERLDALVAVAVQYINEGAPDDVQGPVHRLAKFDTHSGLVSVRHAANESVPYAVLLYERYLGRPFAGHRDAIS